MDSLYQQAIDAIDDLLQFVEPPEANCGCHLSPPCSDCVEYSLQRFIVAQAQQTRAQLEAAELITT